MTPHRANLHATIEDERRRTDDPVIRSALRLVGKADVVASACDRFRGLTFHGPWKGAEPAERTRRLDEALRRIQAAALASEGAAA